MSEAIVATCASRAEAELLVAVLADAGVPGVVFADVVRGVHGEVLREAAEVRILATDVARARSAVGAWREARAQGVDDADLERQALEAAGASVPAEDRDADHRGAPRVAAARPSATVCPHCGASVPEPWGRRLRRAFAALTGRTGTGGGERLCTACGHRWEPAA